MWALNIKRALLSMLQTSRMASKQELVKEVRVNEGSVLCMQQLLCLYGNVKITTSSPKTSPLLLQQTRTVINTTLPKYSALTW